MAENVLIRHLNDIANTQGSLLFDPKNPKGVKVQIKGTLQAEDAGALAELLETVKGCLVASRAEWVRDRLMCEAGFKLASSAALRGTDDWPEYPRERLP